MSEKQVMFDEFEQKKELPYDAFTNGPAQPEVKQGATQSVPTKNEIALSETGAALPKTVEDQYRLAKAYVSSGMLPKQYVRPEQVITGMAFANELGLHPLTGLKSIAVINGNPCIFGDLPLALVMKSGLLESIEEILIDVSGQMIKPGENKELFGAVCRVKRKGLANYTVTSFTLDEAKKAELLSRDPWKKYTKRMLQMRARAQALKDTFPDVLNGIAIEEYDQQEPDSTPGTDKAKELNSMFTSQSAPINADLVTEGVS